jgi:hypothetical protein
MSSLLFLAGHGITDKTGQFFFLAADSDLEKKELTETRAASMPTNWACTFAGASRR